MSNTPAVYHGVVRGKMIELEQPTGLPDGQSVTVTVRASRVGQKRQPGEGLSRSFAGWAEDAQELDEFLAWNRQQRKRGRGELKP